MATNLGWTRPACCCPDRAFQEGAAVGSSTLKAVRHANQLRGEDLCSTCPRRHAVGPNGEQGPWHYMI